MKFLPAFLLLLIAPIAHAIELEIPVDCSVGSECFIQNYVDTDSSEGRSDYRCGPLSYDGHKGTDFRLKNFVQMREGVAVLAAASGKVKALRNQMEDISIRETGDANVEGRECGNGVVIIHDDNWETQYCHMQKGSVVVKKGDQVAAGDKLGLIGISGKSEFPHLHLSIRNPEGKEVDPFTTKRVGEACSTTTPETHLWSAAAFPYLTYEPSALLGIGFTDKKPNAKAVREGKHSKKTLTPEAPAIILWADVMGILPGDSLLLEIIDPEGNIVNSYQKDFIDPKAQYFLFSGKTNKNVKQWHEGIYKGRLSLIRSEHNIHRKPTLQKTIELYIR